jgi:hypothetical protein
MRAFAVAPLIAVLVAAPPAADIHVVTKVTSPGGEVVSSRDEQGPNCRYQYRNGTRPMAMIRNSQGMYELDLQSREYVEFRAESQDFILSMAQWIARPPHIHQSGKAVNIYYETIDTGGRKQFFGRTARHLIIGERHVAETGACDQTYTAETVGWYVPSDAPPVRRNYFHLIGLIRPTFCVDKIAVHGGASPPGIAVLETHGSMTMQVLELSNRPIDKSLFQIPSGFQKVDALTGQRPTTWLDRTSTEWTQPRRAAESWFE